MLSLGRRLRRSIHVIKSDDSGFTLAELLVSLVVLGAVLIGLMAVQVRALQGVSLAKQRQQATGLANRSMEQLRAQPYDSVTAGLFASDVAAGDPNITVVSGVTTFKPTYTVGITEPLVTTTSPVAAPLNPHVQLVALENATFTVRSYVSRVDAIQNLGYWLSVIVSWSGSAAGGQTRTVAARSRLFSPTGCSASSTATRPFAGPCQAFFYTDAGSSPAGISVTPLVAGQPLLVGNDARALDVSTPGLSARTQNEQVVSTQSSATTSTGSITTGGANIAAGGQVGVSAADTDPATGQGGTPAAASPVDYSGTSPSISGATGNFSLALPAASGAAYSTTAASATPSCSDETGAALITGQACSTSSITPAGTYGASLLLTVAGHGPIDLALGRIAAPATPSPWRAYGARAIAPVSGHCSAIVAGQVGCVTSAVQRSLGAVTAGTLGIPMPGDSVPAGFSSMASLTSFNALARAEAGTGIIAPTATRTAMLTYWNGSNYSSISIPASGGAWNLGTAIGTYKTSAVTSLTVSLSGSVVADPVATTGSVPCPTAGCTVSASVGGVRLTVRYDISNGGVPIGSFNVVTDVGSTLAQSTYKAAPSA